jgi:hypothetical protein
VQRDSQDQKVVSEASSRKGRFYTVQGADHYTICKPESDKSPSFTKLIDFLEGISKAAEVDFEYFTSKT